MSHALAHSRFPETVSFGPTVLKIIDRDGRPWITSADLARALGYSRSDQVSRIFDRNKREFTDDMTLTVNLTVRDAVAPKPVRIFSPRGCHLVAMFARTSDARAFRRWVLDVLERLGTEAKSCVQGQYRLPDRDFTHADFNMAADLVQDIRAAVDNWLQPSRAQQLTPTLMHLHRCLVRAWTEMDETTHALSFVQFALKRWKGAPAGRKPDFSRPVKI